MLVCSLAQEWGFNTWRGVLDAAHQHGVNLISFPSSVLTSEVYFRVLFKELFALIKDSRIEGLVIASAGLQSAQGGLKEIEKLAQRFAPLPIVSTESPLKGFPSVITSDYDNMRLIMSHLIETHGCQRVSCSQAIPGNYGMEERYRGYVDALAEHNLPFDPALVIPWDSNGELPLEANVDAFASMWDNQAFMVSQWLLSQGVRIPEDIAVVGFNNSPQCIAQVPPMASLQPPFYEMGYHACEMLLSIIAGQQIPSQPITFLGKFIERASCGCRSTTTAQAAAGPRKASRQSMKSALSTHRLKLIAAISEATNCETSLAERLLDGFITEINGTPEAFLLTLREILHQENTAENALSRWHNGISALRRELLTYTKPTMRSRLEDLWHQARTTISESIYWAETRRTTEAERRINSLSRLSALLNTTFEMEAYINALANELPHLEIPACFLSLYEENSNASNLSSQLVMGYDEQGRITLPPEGLHFQSGLFLPENLWSNQPCSYVMGALSTNERQLGTVLIKTGPLDGNLYDVLQSEIGSTLYSVILTQEQKQAEIELEKAYHELQKHSDELAWQKYVLDTFMENIPDQIYFKDIEGQFTRVNKAFLNKVGLNSIEEIIGKTDFDFFPPDQAQKRHRQEQRIIQRQEVILGLEEFDGISTWTSTTKMPLRNEKGDIIGTFGISTDITELVKAKQLAEMAKEEAEKARRLAEEEKQKAEAANRDLAAQIWQTLGQAQLSERMRGEQDIPTLSRNVIQQLCRYLDVQAGALYYREKDQLKLTGTYAYPRKNRTDAYKIGEGSVGEAAMGLNPIIIHLPQEYLSVSSFSLGKLTPKNALFAPFTFNNEVIGVIELATMDEFSQAQMDFLDKALESIAISFMTAQGRDRVNELLLQTRKQAKELQAHEKKLRTTNTEGKTKANSLKDSKTNPGKH